MVLFTINISDRVINTKYIFLNYVWIKLKNNTFITSGYGDYEQEDLLPEEVLNILVEINQQLAVSNSSK